MRPVITNLLLLIAVVAAAGCSEPTAEDLIGTYTFSFTNVTDKILIRPDGVFRQELTYVGRPSWKLTNHWELVHRVIILKESYLPYDPDTRAALASPRLVGMSAYVWEGNGISKWDGELLWAKSPPQ